MRTFTKHVIASAVGFSLMGLANAASIVVNTEPGSVLSGGTTTFEFSRDHLNLMDTTEMSIEPLGAGISKTLFGDFGDYLAASISSPTSGMSLDSDTHEILSSTSSGGVTLTVPKRTAVSSSGGSLSISNLQVDLRSKQVYADIVGTNGVGTLSQLHLWDFASVNTSFDTANAIGDMPFVVVTQTLSGISWAQEDSNSYIKALSLYEIGVNAFNLVGDFGTITMVNNFNVPADYFAAAVPEPSTWALTSLGLLSMGVMMRRRLAKAATLA